MKQDKLSYWQVTPSVRVCLLWARKRHPHRWQKCKQTAKKQHLLPKPMSSPINNITLEQESILDKILSLLAVIKWLKDVSNETKYDPHFSDGNSFDQKCTYFPEKDDYDYIIEISDTQKDFYFQTFHWYFKPLTCT